MHERERQGGGQFFGFPLAPLRVENYENHLPAPAVHAGHRVRQLPSARVGFARILARRPRLEFTSWSPSILLGTASRKKKGRAVVGRQKKKKTQFPGVWGRGRGELRITSTPRLRGPKAAAVQGVFYRYGPGALYRTFIWDWGNGTALDDFFFFFFLDVCIDGG